jgi:hypothetical protein
VVKEHIKEHFMLQYLVVYGEYENEKKKEQIIDLTNGDLNLGSCPRFEF